MMSTCKLTLLLLVHPQFWVFRPTNRLPLAIRYLAGFFGGFFVLISCLSNTNAQEGGTMSDSFTQNIEQEILTDFAKAETDGWQLSTDRVMGGVSNGQAQLIRSEEGIFAQLSGTVSTENNGGFIQIRKRFVPGTASGFDGVFVRARGNSETYAIHLRNNQSTRPWLNYRQSFNVTDKWQDILIPFETFKPSRAFIMPIQFDTDSIYSLGIVAFGGDFYADLQVQSVGFYRNQISAN